MTTTFTGEVRIPGSIENGLPSTITLDAQTLVLTAGGTELGRWNRADLKLRREPDGSFHLTLGREVVLFNPDSPLEFAILSGMPGVGTAPAPAAPAEPPVAAPPPAVTPEPAAAAPPPTPAQPVAKAPEPVSPAPQPSPVAPPPAEPQPVPTPPPATMSTPPPPVPSPSTPPPTTSPTTPPAAAPQPSVPQAPPVTPQPAAVPPVATTPTAPAAPAPVEPTAPVATTTPAPVPPAATAAPPTAPQPTAPPPSTTSTAPPPAQAPTAPPAAPPPGAPAVNIQLEQGQPAPAPAPEAPPPAQPEAAATALPDAPVEQPEGAASQDFWDGFHAEQAEAVPGAAESASAAGFALETDADDSETGEETRVGGYGSGLFTEDDDRPMHPPAFSGGDEPAEGDRSWSYYDGDDPDDGAQERRWSYDDLESEAEAETEGESEAEESPAFRSPVADREELVGSAKRSRFGAMAGWRPSLPSFSMGSSELGMRAREAMSVLDAILEENGTEDIPKSFIIGLGALAAFLGVVAVLVVLFG